MRAKKPKDNKIHNINFRLSDELHVKKCQVDNSLFFNGSNGDPLAEQLKALYLKQEFTNFAYENQGLNAAELQKNFNEFVQRTQPSNLDEPSWSPGVPND